MGKARHYHAPHWLQVGDIQVWTTLTKDDLDNPKLWYFRTPQAWARSIWEVTPRTITERPNGPEHATRPPRGGNASLFNPKSP